MKSHCPAKQDSNLLFGRCFILHPTSTHTHTAVFLHGRGSTGKEFADDLLASNLTNGQNLPEVFPGWRWVFPSSPVIWSTIFEEEMPAWFDAYSLTDTNARQDLQIKGIRASVNHIQSILQAELALLHGKLEAVILGGISQGAAVGLWTLLSCKSHGTDCAGAFVGASTWLPFATNVERMFDQCIRPSGNEEDEPTRHEFDDFVADMVSVASEQSDQPSYRLPPVFLGHGADDAYVDVGLGRQVTRILRQLGMSVEWREYTGAEEEGHWFKVPDEMDDVCTFLRKNVLQDLHTLI